GLLVTVAMALFMGAIVTLGQQERLWERKVRYDIHFARTNGLQVGAPVSLTGVVIGSVVDMQFPADPTAAYIEVVIGVTKNVAPRLRENSVATIRTYGLLGDRYIELTTGSPDAAPVPPDGLLPSLDPIDYEAVLGQSGDIVTNIVEVTASLKDVLGSIQRGEGLLGAMVRNRELGEATLVDLQHTMANVQETTRVLEKILRRVEHGQGLLGQLTGPSKEGDELLARVGRASRSLERFARRLERGQGALPQLVEDETYARRPPRAREPRSGGGRSGRRRRQARSWPGDARQARERPVALPRGAGSGRPRARELVAALDGWWPCVGQPVDAAHRRSRAGGQGA